MKSSQQIVRIALTISIQITAAASDRLDSRTAGEKPVELSFSKFYEPREPNIEPNAPGYALPLDIDNIMNVDTTGRFGPLTTIDNFDRISGAISQNGFVVLEHTKPIYDDIVNVYEFLSFWQSPLFITSDSILHLYHIQFDQALLEIEEREFVSDIVELTSALLNGSLELHTQLEGDLQEAARRNVAYFAVAKKLLAPDYEAPPFVVTAVGREVAKIEAHRGFARSDIFFYEEDYSQYVPRGHYAHNDALERYFKAIMWFGRMAFLMKGSDPSSIACEALVSPQDAKIQTLQALLLSTSLKDVRVGDRIGLEVWDRLYRATAFFTGFADDLTPYDYLWALDRVFGESFVVADLTRDECLLALTIELASLPSAKVYGGTGNIVLSESVTEESLNEMLERTKGMRLMGRRFTLDSYIFQHMSFPQVGPFLGDSRKPPFTAGNNGMGGLHRGYVRGLDLMALLRSEEALKILVEDGDTDYRGFWQEFGGLKDELEALNPSDWNANLHWCWLYTLSALVRDLPEGYPNFMRTDAWQRRQLHAALASWTQLRHDAILFVKQGYTTGGASPPPPGYIEPVPVFWARLLALAEMTVRGLDDLNLLSAEARERLTGLEHLVRRALEIVAKELTNEALSPADHAWIKSLPLTMERIITGVPNQELKTSLVADVHTNSLEGFVVEEAVGNVDLILVACPMPDGKAFLAAGPVLSYYEFKHPMSDRLTDKTWREMLDAPEIPSRPLWYRPMVHRSTIGPGGRG